MEERRIWSKAATARMICKAIGGIIMAAGWVLAFLAGAAAVEGFNESARCAMMAENIDKEWISASDLYPVQGVSYVLEGRILTDEGNGAWYHGAIAANYGDVVEIRLTAVTADAGAMDYDAVVEQTTFMRSAGLQVMTIDSRPSQVILPNGSLVDYFEDGFNEHITHVAMGIYSVGRQDWWAGNGASTLSAYIDGNTVAKFVVVTPDCEVDIRMTLTLGLISIGFILAGILIFTLVATKLSQCIERASK